MGSYQLHHGDCRDVMADLAISGAQFHLIYADPPFLSHADYFTTASEFAFSDKWSNDDDYYGLIRRVAVHALDLLTDDGCFVLHVDPRTSHRLKLILDDVFGAHRFASEIIWRYRRWPAKTPNFQRVHDVLLRYVKDPANVRWNQLYEPLAESTLKQWGTGKQRAVVENGKRSRSSTTEEASPGAPMSDVWDIGIVAPSSNERTGYPTQKPLALLNRVITSCTYPDDRVLDPFCGSGTTLVAAKNAGRHGVGIDASDVAIRYATERLDSQRGLFDALDGGTHA